MSQSRGPLNPQLTMAIKAPSACSKPECVQELLSFGVDAPDSLTLVELRALVKRNRVSHGYMGGPSDPNDLMQQIQKGTLAELKIFAQKHQINHAANISHGDLRLHLRRWLYRSGTPETVVSFGRHQGKTFQEVLQEDKQYLQWGLKEASSNASAGWQLVQLVTWAVLDGHLDSPFDSDMKGHAAKSKHSHGTELESILAIDPEQYKIPENDLNQDEHIKKKQANGPTSPSRSSAASSSGAAMTTEDAAELLKTMRAMQTEIRALKEAQENSNEPKHEKVRRQE